RHLPAHARTGPCRRRHRAARRAPGPRRAHGARHTQRRRHRRLPARDHGRSPVTSRRFWELTWTLAVTDWRLRFYGSALGYLWALPRPCGFLGSISVVFAEVADIGNEVKDYGICILFSMVLFQFFGEATNGAVTAIVRRENLLRKMRFPQLVVPLSTVLTALMNLGATLVAVFLFAIASGVYPTWGWL